MTSRRAALRRIVAPLALVGAVALIARDACARQEREPTTFVLELGDRAPEVRDVRIDLWVDTTSLGFYHQRFSPPAAPAAVRFAQPVSRDRVELTAAVTFADGQIQTLRRLVRTAPGGEVVVGLPPARPTAPR